MIAKKVLLVGNFGVGKTSLIRRFVHNEFSEDYISTIGVRVSSKIVEINSETIKLLIWDVRGTSDDEKIPQAYFLGASAAMYVFDASRIETYSDLKQNVEAVKQLSGLQKLLIVGNKIDLLSTVEIEEIKGNININVDIFTSAKENNQVENAFIQLANYTLK